MSPPTCRLLVEGMHCPSCVRHIEELLSEHGLRSIVVSLFAGTVSFEHDPDFDLKRVLVELKDSGYRPVLPEKQHGAGEHPNRSTPMPRSRWLDRLRPARRQQRRRHRAVCEACRLEEEQDSAKPEVLPVHPVVTSTQTKSVFSIEGMTCGCVRPPLCRGEL